MSNKADTHRPKHGQRGTKGKSTICLVDLMYPNTLGGVNGSKTTTNDKQERFKEWEGYLRRSILKQVTRVRSHPFRGIVEQAKASV